MSTLIDYRPSRYTVLKCVEMAKNVYEYDWCEKQDVFVNNKETDTQAIVSFKWPETAYVCFRGTSSGKDIKTDLNALKATLKSGSKVHEGFLKSFLSIWEDVLKHVENYNNIIVSGHSLGSSLSTLFSYYLKKKHPHKNIVLIGFCSPKVGNCDFVKEFDSLGIKAVFISHYLDRVAHLPLLTYSYMSNQVRFWKWNPTALSQHSVENIKETISDKYHKGKV